jgi:hypothetical protein
MKNVAHGLAMYMMDEDFSGAPAKSTQIATPLRTLGPDGSVSGADFFWSRNLLMFPDRAVYTVG